MKIRGASAIAEGRTAISDPLMKSPHVPGRTVARSFLA
jgi:hypothetical protein